MIPAGSCMVCGECGATFAVSLVALPEGFLIESAHWRRPDGRGFLPITRLRCAVCHSFRINRLARVAHGSPAD